MPEGSFFRDVASPPAARDGARQGGRGATAPPAPALAPRVAAARRPIDPDAAAGGLRLPRSLGECVGVLRRRWPLIAATALLCSLVTVAVTWRMASLFRAEAVVLLDTRDLQITDIKGVLPSRPFDNTVVRGEMEVLKSPALGAQVAEKLHLDQDANFAGVGGDARQRLKRAGDAVAHGLNVLNDGRSLVLKLDFAARTPQQAADIANAFAEAYIERQLAMKEAATRRATEWLKGQITALHGQIADTEQRIADFQRTHGITPARGTVTAQELAEINTQLIVAHGDTVQKEAALHRAREVLNGAGGAEAVREVLISPIMQRLRDHETDLTQRMAELATRYRPAHPTMVKLQAELDTLRGKIRDEANRIVRTMTEEANAARAREETLKANLAELTQSTAQQESGQSELHALEREADANRSLYEALVTRLKQTAAQEDIQQPDAQIIARAEPPGAASGQDRRQLLFTAGGMSLLWGLLLAFAVDGFDASFRRLDEVELATGLPVLGLVPIVRPAARGRTSRLQREALLSEALLGIRSGLRQAQAGVPIGSLLVTSAGDAEGKSFFAIALGRSVARAGLRCLLMDCHFQRPAVAALLGPAGQAAAPPTRYPQIQVDKASGLHYIAAPPAEQRRLFRSQDLFESTELRTWLERMRGQYDLIILDGPPAPAAAEVVALARIADATVLLARWGRTPRRAVLGALRFLAMRGVGVAGTVLSRVDLGRYATYGYGEFVRYLEDAAGPARPR
ncbi:MAG TPA: polysaccharide biosynthesis tyrosine autokinase [Myxococcales bacterium]|nr:polysaccharide biosynthesis tyrosine autokinase [Myxococcales bacterium]